ncbi:MAG TPA: pyridoxamine 5'-phosphate oxidase family protein [Nitrososphaeraceae archaeon]|jgi:general stress protein 26
MSDSTTTGIKIINAHGKLGTLPLNAKELTEFLKTPELLVHLGTIDEKGEPDDVRPTWYYFDSLNDRLYVGTNKKLSKMIRNLEKNMTISFCIDDSRPDQYKGVRGKGDVSIHEDIGYTTPIFMNIASRYVQADENYLRETKKGDYVILEIKPRYYSTWTIIKGET